jgi:hypothetical protein
VVSIRGQRQASLALVSCPRGRLLEAVDKGYLSGAAAYLDQREARPRRLVKLTVGEAILVRRRDCTCVILVAAAPPTNVMNSRRL